jgi:SAM-dependent methyltransferase
MDKYDLIQPPPRIYCSDGKCRYAEIGFSIIGDQPILIDFEASIFDEKKFLANDARSFIPRDNSKMRLKTRMRRFVTGRNRVAELYCIRFIETMKAQLPKPRVLIIGGGEVGSGANLLYSEPDLQVVGTDVYASPHTMIVSDGHHLPFCDNSFDGVWIQAVLEHVLEPNVVVSEIHRVLKSDGVVYADTPFMQQVHEGAFDFTRFTLSGHRWLFRKFQHDSSGTVSGAGTALIWSIRYFMRALTGSDRIAWLTSSAVFWLRYFDLLTKKRPNADAACGVFFFGRKRDDEISAKSMITFYEQQGRR